MPSIMIESLPLSPKQAAVILNILKSVQIQGGMAGEFLALTLSVERIAAGMDTVVKGGAE